MLNSPLDSNQKHHTEKIILILCLLIIVTILLHIGFLENKFIDGDDLTRVVQNPLIRNISFEGLRHDIKGYYLYHYPVFLVSYFWGCVFSIWELNHIRFHFISFLLHAICVSLLFLLLLRMTAKILPSFAGALLLGLHPLHCETVNWINRQDILMAVFFGLLYLHLLLWEHRFAKVLSIVSVGISICFSPVAVLFLPGGCLIATNSKKGSAWKEWIVPIVVWVGVWGGKFHGVSIPHLFTVAPWAVVWFLRDVFMPWKIHFMLPVLSGGSFLGGVVAIILIVATTWFTFKRKKGWGALSLGLVSVWFFHFFSSRLNGGYSYMPLLWGALSLGMGFSAVELSSISRKVTFSLVFMAIFTMLAGWSYERNKAWRNTNELLSDALKASPADEWLLAMLGHYKAALLNRKESERLFRRIVHPTFETLCLEAKAYHLLLDTKTANRLFQKLFEKYPRKEKDKFCVFDYAVLQTQMGNLDASKKMLKKIVVRDPYFIYAWHDLGSLYLREGKSAVGIAYLNKVLEVAPAYRPTLESLAYFYMRQGDRAKASAYIRVALRSTSCPDTRDFYKGWLAALKSKKPFKYASLQWADLKPPT